MKKTFNRLKVTARKIFSAVLAFAMAISVGATTASAAWYNNSFTLSPGSYNRGQDRYYDGNYMAYEILVTDASGKPANSAIILLELRSYDGLKDQREVTIKDGRVKVDWISIQDHGCYYFTYRSLVTSPSAGKVNIEMTMYSWY